MPEKAGCRNDLLLGPPSFLKCLGYIKFLRDFDRKLLSNFCEARGIPVEFLCVYSYDLNGLESAGGQFKKTRTSTNLGTRLNFRCTSADITIVTAIPSAFHSRNEPSERILCCSRRRNLSYRRPLGKLQIPVEFLQWCHSMVANDGALFSHCKISRNRNSECRIFTALESCIEITVPNFCSSSLFLRVFFTTQTQNISTTHFTKYGVLPHNKVFGVMLWPP